MAGVFISYRREDSAGWAGRIYDRACGQFGVADVFLDVGAIAPGDDFASAIEDTLDQVHTVVVVIGPRWLEARNDRGGRRLDDPADYVRRELAIALDRDVRIVPVLVDDARMPSEPDLPERIRSLARRNALLVSDTWFDHDIERLLEAIEEASPEAASETRHNLPARLASVVGREDDLTELGRRVRESRLVTLTGVGGSGKTTLAIKFARGQLDSFPDGVWFVDLSTIEDPERVPWSVASALDVKEHPTRSITDQLARRLEAERTLLVLDNCEHVIESAASLTENLLNYTKSMRIVATSREPLEVLGEELHPVGTLELPAEADRDVQSVETSPAVQLLVDRATAARPGFALKSQNAADIAAICRRVDGLPLAIELAAARLNILSSGELIARLDNRFALLSETARHRPERHQTLIATLDWSHELLTHDEKALFRRLAVFQGSFALDSAEEVCSGNGLEPGDMVDLTSELLKKSLVVATRGLTGRRFRFLETVREYARSQLNASGEQPGLEEAHARHFHNLAVETFDKLWGANEVQRMDRLIDEWPNLVRAIAWHDKHEDFQAGLLLAGSLYRVSVFRFHDNDGLVSWLRRFLSADDRRTPARARALRGLGTLSNNGREWLPLLNEAIDLSRELDLDEELVAALNNAAFAATHTGDWDTARSYAEELVSMNHPDALARSFHLGQLALVITEADQDPLRALPIVEESLHLARKSGSRLRILETLVHLARVRRLCDDLGGAESALTEAVAVEAELEGQVTGPGNTYYELVELALARSDFDQAVALLADRTKMIRRRFTEEDDLGLWHGFALDQWARVAIERGRYDACVTLLAAQANYWNEMSWVRRPSSKRAVDEALATARRNLGDDRFQQTWDRGTAMSIQEALELAEEAAN